ncbi:MAG: SDR family NAD(P)-dependent oxidoreductase, partial [Oceanobacter sp.]
QALIEKFRQQEQPVQLVSVSRSNMNFEKAGMHPQPVHLKLDLTQPDSKAELASCWKSLGYPTQVFHCSGVLHDQHHQPEKSLQQLDADWLTQSLMTNVMTHVHLAQSIAAGVNQRHSVRWLSLSALVSSITENALGGWYSYRMSKAALNMFIRNLDIEWRRRNPNCRIAAVHPGTTDTPLSEPFQAGIKAGKLYTPELTAERMLDIMQSFPEASSGQLLFWDGSIRPF